MDRPSNHNILAQDKKDLHGALQNWRRHAPARCVPLAQQMTNEFQRKEVLIAEAAPAPTLFTCCQSPNVRPRTSQAACLVPSMEALHQPTLPLAPEETGAGGAKLFITYFYDSLDTTHATAPTAAETHRAYAASPPARQIRRTAKTGKGLTGA